MLIRLLALAAIASLGLVAPAAAQVRADAGFGADGLAGCSTDLLHLNQLFGWQVRWPAEWRSYAAASDAEVRSAIDQWREAPRAIAAAQEALSSSAPSQKAPRVVVERIIPQVSALLAELRAAPPPLAASVAPALRQEWEGLFTREVAPAIDRYARFLEGRYLPTASSASGLSGSPEGAACFRRSVRQYTTLDLRSEAIEQIGRRLLDETEAELATLYGIPRTEIPVLLETLRTPSEPNFTSDALVALSKQAIARATAAMPRMFHRPVFRQVGVEKLPSAMEESFAAGFYRPPQGDGPATYVINSSRPSDRRLMAEVIAFHETLPGHHLRSALDLPDGSFNSGFGEGWALYAEYLADEMGLYSARIDRAGMMAKHLWAASRLVIEPGLHLHGWTRDQAVAFMRRHTALADAEIALEVDRYIATPGQSLSYMLGYDRIASARAYAQAKMGGRFDLRDFHDVVLGEGARPLDAMYADVVRWADKAAAAP